MSNWNTKTFQKWWLKKIGLDKETIYKELSSNILLSFLIDVKSGELWKKIK